MNNRIDVLLTKNPVADPAMTLVDNLTERITGPFSWSIDAFGGFATAHFEMVLSAPEAYEMLQRLGDRVVFLSPEARHPSMICWEGMIHSIAIDDGGASVGYSLETCYNRIRVNFPSLNFATLPPSVGGLIGTDDRTDAESVQKYGRRCLTYVTTPRTMEDGIVMRDLFLERFANPTAATTLLRAGGGSSPSSARVMVDCVGFVHEMGLNFHGETSLADTTLDQILAAIITNTAYGNIIGSSVPIDGNYSGLMFVDRTDVSGIAPNTLMMNRYNLSDKTTRTYVNEIIAKGDGATGRRTFWGYYENRKFWVTVESDTWDYYLLRSDAGERIIDRRSGSEVPPWDVRPGKVIAVPDVFADGFPDATSQTTPIQAARTFVIGRVDYTFPSTVVLTPVTPDPSSTWGPHGYAPTAITDANGLYPWEAGYTLPPLRPPPTP